MYKVRLFYREDILQEFLNAMEIKKEKIVSISIGGKYGSILLVYEV